MREEVIKLIASVLKVSVDDVTLDTEIGDLDEWDSLHNMQIFAEIEDKFDVKITSDMLVDLEDVSDIINLIESLK